MDPIKWKSKIILVKPEGAAYGQDAVPTGGANAMLLTDVSLQPMEGEDVSRNIEQAFMGAQEVLPSGLRAVLTGSFELVGSGTAGTAPLWGPLMRACASAEVVTPGTSVVYSPISDGHESVSIYFWIGPSRHVLLGARGTITFTMNAQGIPVGKAVLTGLFTTPADAARAVPDLSGWQGPQVASKANTPVFKIGGVSFILRAYELAQGHDVQPRLLVNDERIVIVDKAETLSCTVQAVPYAVYNPFAIAQARTRQEVVIQHGTAVGKIVTIDVSSAQQKRPTGLSNQQNVVEWQLAFTPLQVAGDDQWKITLT